MRVRISPGSVSPIYPMQTVLRLRASALLRSLRSGLFAAAVALLAPTPQIQAQAPAGAVEGRVQNALSGSYLSNARIRVVGTSVEAFTNGFGEYRVTGLPPGPA